MLILGVIIGLVCSVAVHLFFCKYAIVERGELEKCQEKLEEIENKLEALMANQNDFISIVDESEEPDPDYFE